MSNNTKPQVGILSQSWSNLSYFFEYGRLEPFAVLTSIYHYYIVLSRLGDPFFVSIAVAVIIDMLHYRTVREAWRERKTWTILIAVVTTAMAIGYHWAFYNYAEFSFLLTTLYAFPIPIGIGVMAYHSQVNEGREIITATDILNDANDKIEKATALNSDAVKMQRDATEMQDGARVVQANAKEMQEKVLQMQLHAIEMQTQITQLKEELERIRPLAKHYEMLTDETKLLIAYGLGHDTAENVASSIGKNETTVRRLSSKLLNGNTATTMRR